MSNSLGLLLHPFNLSRLCRVIWYQQGRMHLRPRFAEVSQFQDSKSKFQIQVRAETQSMGKNTKMSHTHTKLAPVMIWRGLTRCRMRHVGYMFFSCPANSFQYVQFVEIYQAWDSIHTAWKGTLAKMAHHRIPHVFGKMLQKDRKIRPPKSVQSLIASVMWKGCFWGAKKSVLRFCCSFFSMEREEEKTQPPKRGPSLKKDDIRLICHLAGRSEDGIYSWSPIYRPYALYIYLHIYWRIKSAYMPETITVFSKDGVCMAFFAEDFSVGVSSSWYLQLCCFISLPLTTMSLPNFLASRNSRFACFS